MRSGARYGDAMADGQAWSLPSSNSVWRRSQKNKQAGVTRRGGVEGSTEEGASLRQGLSLGKQNVCRNLKNE